MTLHDFAQIALALPHTPRFPTLFVGHGSPMNAVEKNTYTESWAALGRDLPRPSAILAISAHWLTDGVRVEMSERPKTIHDFFGFPKALYDLSYDCPGAPEVARSTANLLAPTSVSHATDWGVDHGTWVVLRHMFPDANIPVFQMSIDVGRSHRAHYELGALLAPLRERGVLIMGSGNLVHNLGKISWEEGAKPFDWATHFDEQAAALIKGGNHDALIAYAKLGTEAALAIPTPDHYWPLLYTLGAGTRDEEVTFPVVGIAHGSIAMRAAKIG